VPEPYGNLSFGAAGAKVHHLQLVLPVGGQRSGGSASEMRNSSNDLPHLSFAESARRSTRICVRPFSSTTGKPLFFDARKWWAAGKVLSTGPVRPACHECV
jgi:hypothetical protein